ncbi:MAG: hypothetical protein GF401_03940 [Chitinivibrionales bacterium]|nr:hypothetical protein [Chitinivibrionales bacterium]
MGTRSTKLALLSFLLIIGGSSCVINVDDDDERLTMIRADKGGDTVSVFPAIKIAFSVPLAVDTVMLAMTPPFQTGYAAYLNDSKDTLEVRVTGMLEGNTRYCIKLAHAIKAENGFELYPDADSIVFVTHPAESEPNNSISTANQLNGRVFGMIELATDTDYYFIPSLHKRKFYLNSFDSQCGFAVSDSDGVVQEAFQSQTQSDTLIAGDSLFPPFHVLVFASPLSSHERYELGSVDVP